MSSQLLEKDDTATRDERITHVSLAVSFKIAQNLGKSQSLRARSRNRTYCESSIAAGTGECYAVGVSQRSIVTRVWRVSPTAQSSEAILPLCSDEIKERRTFFLGV